MPATADEADPRCLEIRELFPDFLNERLGVAKSGEVQGHLLTCDSCTELFGEMVMNAVEKGPLLTPAAIPSQNIFDAYLLGRSGRFGIFFARMRHLMSSENRRAAEWARKQLEGFSLGLRSVLASSSQPLPVVRARGSASGPPAIAEATVLSSAFESTGIIVPFAVDEVPRITSVGDFELKLSTNTPGYEGWYVACTVEAPGASRVSFVGELRGDATGAAWQVAIDERGVDGPAGAIPIGAINLTLTKVNPLSVAV
jgi:hypothetical protein